MFNVGRYDPRAEEREDRKKCARYTQCPSKSKGKRRRKNNDEVGRSIEKSQKTAKISRRESSDENASSPETEELLQDRSIQRDKHEKTADGTESDSSSSVPSSSEDSDDSEDGNSSSRKLEQPTLHVIAPEAASNSTNHVRGLTDEAFDDFDVDDELLDDNDDVGEVSAQAGSQQPDYKKLPKEIKTALHMSSLPIDEAAAAWDLAPFLISNLKRDGHDNFFPIQSLVIPDVITSERHAHVRARDVCVAAPTGSGKTLSFVLPVLNALSKRNIRRLRALVVLPSRDLGTYNEANRLSRIISMK